MDAPRHVLRDLYSEMRENLKIDSSLLADLYSVYVITLDAKNAINKMDETSYSDRAEYLLDRLQGCSDKFVELLCAALAKSSCEPNRQLSETIANMQREKALRASGMSSPTGQSSRPASRGNSHTNLTNAVNPVAVTERLSEEEKLGTVAQGRPDYQQEQGSSATNFSGVPSSTSFQLDASCGPLKHSDNTATFQTDSKSGFFIVQPQHVGSTGIEETSFVAAGTSNAHNPWPAVREDSRETAGALRADAPRQKPLGRAVRMDDIRRGYDIAILGASNVGKTKLIQFLNGDRFEETHITFFDNKTIQLDVDGASVQLTLWDTAGTERFCSRKILMPTLRHCHGIILMFDVTEADSLQALQHWRTEAEKICPSATVLVLGNKLDQPSEREVPDSKGEKVAKSFGAAYMPCSAKTGENAQEACVYMIRNIMKKREDDLSQSRNAIRLQQEKETQRGKPRCRCRST